MLKKRFSIVAVIIACICSCILVVGGLLYTLHSVTGSLSGTFKFLRALSIVHTSFIDTVDYNKLYEGAIKGMVNALGDPYSVYLDEEKYKSLIMNTEGHFGGIGVVIGMKDNNFVVIAPLKGTPGDRAGIKSGDKITAIDGKKTAGQTLEEVVAQIRGKEGTSVEIELKTVTDEVKTVRVIRSDIKLETVVGEMKNNRIGYIRIGMFNENTGLDFIKKFHELESQGMEGLVLDLRDNPGGLLSESVKVAELIVPKGPIVSVTERSGKSITEYSNLEKTKYPVAVIVNQGTASAAEIVAGALQDTKAGKLFGTKTFGKGSVQSVNNLDENSGLKLTIARYYTPSGRSINGTGIEPDVAIESDETGENQLAAAISYLEKELVKK
ncbi:MAG: S41 family peptidase [Acidaminococcaceae bacterium]